MALRRLKPLLCAFEQIDAAIEAADAAGCRDGFRSARAQIIEMVCAAADDEGGGEKAEGLCAFLDEAMGEALATLRVVPAEKIALEAGDLVRAVGELMWEHPSERVRGLAGDVASGWRACVTAEVDRARARAVVVLDGTLATPPPPPRPLDDTAPTANSDLKLKKKIQEEQPRPRSSSVVSNSGRVRTVETYAPLSKSRSDPIISTSYAKPPANMGAPAAVPTQPKKAPPVVASSVAEVEEKMQATKRKLHERYQEAEDAKRRRTIQVIKPPRPPPGTTGQRKGNAHPGMRARAPASCTGEKRFVKSSLLRMNV